MTWEIERDGRRIVLGNDEDEKLLDCEAADDGSVVFEVSDESVGEYGVLIRLKMPPHAVRELSRFLAGKSDEA